MVLTVAGTKPGASITHYSLWCYHACLVNISLYQPRIIFFFTVPLLCYRDFVALCWPLNRHTHNYPWLSFNHLQFTNAQYWSVTILLQLLGFHWFIIQLSINHTINLMIIFINILSSLFNFSWFAPKFNIKFNICT